MSGTKPFTIEKRDVWEAFQHVDANQGAAGVDGQTLESFGERLGPNLYKLWNRMSSGSYMPSPVRRVMIPKAVHAIAGASGDDPQSRWRPTTVGHSDGHGPHRAGGCQTVS